MRLYQEKRKIRRFLNSRPVLVLLLLTTLLLAVTSSRNAFRALRAYQAKEGVQREYEELLSQKERLDKKISELEDPARLEKEAKERFNVTAPDEEVLVIVGPKLEPENLTARPPYQRFWEFVKNIFR